MVKIVHGSRILDGYSVGSTGLIGKMQKKIMQKCRNTAFSIDSCVEIVQGRQKSMAETLKIYSIHTGT